MKVALPIFKKWFIESSYNGQGWTGSRGDICKVLLRKLLASPNPPIIYFNSNVSVKNIFDGTMSVTNGNDHQLIKFD